MMRARSYLLVPLVLVACQRGGPSTTTTPADASSDAVAQDQGEAPVASGEGLPIVAVRQQTPSVDPSLWRFDPSGRLIAEELMDDDGIDLCGIWDIESGTFVREHRYSDDDPEDAFDPCYDWDADPRSLPDSSADGKLRAYVDGGLEIEIIDGPSRSVRGCASCDDAMVWAPSGHQLATCNGTMLEIWDADTGKRLRSETLGIGDVLETLIGWTDEGIGVVVLHEISAPCEELEPDGSYCDYASYEDYGDYDEDGEQPDEPEPMDGHALSSFWLPADGGPPIASVALHKSLEMLDVHTDVGVRWLAFYDGVDYDRDGLSTTVYVHGVGPRTSALGWTDDDEDEGWSERWEGHWRVDAATQWIEGWTAGDGDDYGYGEVEVGWDSIVAEPNPAAFRGQVGEAEGAEPWGEVEVFAASGGAAVTRWQACTVEGVETCKTGGPPVRDCELLDVSPLLSLALVHCEAGLRLVEAGGRGSTVFSLPHDPDSDWRWGRGNYLALLELDKLSVVDLTTGKALYQRDDVLELLEVPLAPEQDRLALVYADHLEIIAGPTGARVIDVPGDWSAAALSPDGKQLATLGDKQVHVIDIETGSTITTAPVGDAYGVAWRQDGAALFYGYDWPTHAINPKTGALLYELDHPILDVLDLEEIDPSWRWIHRPDGSITRVLDFQRIELGPTWARIDSGMFEGKLEHLPRGLRYRVGDDPHGPAIYTEADLEPWLRSPGLVQAFFAGKPLPSPRIPAEALAKLEQGKKKG